MTYKYVFIIAGCHAEAKDWAKDKGLRPDQWRYAHDLFTVKGLWRTSKFAAVGSYKDRPDYAHLRIRVNIIKPPFVDGYEFERQLKPRGTK